MKGQPLTMKTIDELSREELAEIVAGIRALAFLDMDGDGDFWNPDKPLGADFIGEVRDLLARHGLRPQTARRDAHNCLQEFVNDVEAVGPETVQEEWPDLYATYREAKRVL